MGITPSPCSDLKFALPSSSAEYIVLLPCSTDDSAPSFCSTEDVAPPPCSAEDVTPTPCSTKDVVPPSSFMEDLAPPSGFVDEVTPPSYSALGFVPSRLPFLRYAKDIAPPHCSEDVLPALLRVALPVDLISLRAPTSRGTCPGLIMTMYFALDQGPQGVVRSVMVVPK